MWADIVMGLVGTVVAVPVGVLLGCAAVAPFCARVLPVSRLRNTYARFVSVSPSQRTAIEKTVSDQSVLVLALTQAEEKKALLPAKSGPEAKASLDADTNERLQGVAAEISAAVREASETGDREYIRQVVSVQTHLAENVKALNALVASGEVSAEEQALFEENLTFLGQKLEKVKSARKADGGKELRVLNKYLREELTATSGTATA